MKRSLDINFQEAGDLWEKDSRLSLLESTDTAGLPTPPLRLPICSQFTRVPSPPSWEELGDVGSFGTESLRIRKTQTKNLKPNALEEESHHH